ncbi:hypothetical protein ABIB27_003045 [Arthrobacter sp. UYEF21]
MSAPASRDDWKKGWRDSNIKLSSVFSTLSTQSARRILDALSYPENVTRRPWLRWHTPRWAAKSAALVEALTGRFTDHHAFMVPLHLDRIDQIEATLTALDARIDCDGTFFLSPGAADDRPRDIEECR